MDGDYGWYRLNSNGDAHPVGEKKPNAWGLYDMSGNVDELGLDWYGPLAYGLDPKGPASGKFRVLRGGDYYLYESSCRSSSRSSTSSDADWRLNQGFRLARPLQ